jgi:hypothetical protein
MRQNDTAMCSRLHQDNGKVCGSQYHQSSAFLWETVRESGEASYERSPTCSSLWVELKRLNQVVIARRRTREYWGETSAHGETNKASHPTIHEEEGSQAGPEATKTIRNRMILQNAAL